MTLYFLGRKAMSPTILNDIYFIKKRTGCFLMFKNKSRMKTTFRLRISNLGTIHYFEEETEVDYKDLQNTYEKFANDISQIGITNFITIEDIVNKLSTHYLKHLIIDEIVIDFPTTTSISPITMTMTHLDLTYTTKNGVKISGTFQQIMSVCNLIGETVEMDKLTGIDINKLYYSKSKKEWMEIEKMANQHIMHAIISKVRSYYESLKIKNDTTIEGFFGEIVKWSDDQLVQNLKAELLKRVKTSV